MMYIPGSQSGIQKGRRGTVPRASRRDFAAHWDGGPTPTTPAGELSLLKGYERYHNSKGWGGLGYNIAAGPVTGNVYEGCGLDYLGAGVANQNTPVISCILIGGPGNLTTKGKQALRDAYALANRHTGKRLGQKVHRDFGGTTCPGDAIAAFVHGGGLTGGNPPATGGVVSSLNPNGYHPTYVSQVQTLLIKNGYHMGKWGPDGVLGQVTFDAVKAFQKKVGLTVDGIPGPDTLAALKRGGSTIPKPQGSKLDVDGIIGAATIKRLQALLGTAADGVVSSQAAHNKAYLYTWTTIKYAANPVGSQAIIALQKRLGVTADGLLGPATIRAWQKRLGITVDGYCGPQTAKAIQKALNAGKVI